MQNCSQASSKKKNNYILSYIGNEDEEFDLWRTDRKDNHNTSPFWITIFAFLALDFFKEIGGFLKSFGLWRERKYWSQYLVQAEMWLVFETHSQSWQIQHGTYSKHVSLRS